MFSILGSFPQGTPICSALTWRYFAPDPPSMQSGVDELQNSAPEAEDTPTILPILPRSHSHLRDLFASRNPFSG
jgi:hypothetical protein